MKAILYSEGYIQSGNFQFNEQEAIMFFEEMIAGWSPPMESYVTDRSGVARWAHIPQKWDRGSQLPLEAGNPLPATNDKTGT